MVREDQAEILRKGAIAYMQEMISKCRAQDLSAEVPGTDGATFAGGVRLLERHIEQITPLEHLEDLTDYLLDVAGYPPQHLVVFTNMGRDLELRDEAQMVKRLIWGASWWMVEQLEASKPNRDESNYLRAYAHVRRVLERLRDRTAFVSVVHVLRGSFDTLEIVKMFMRGMQPDYGPGLPELEEREVPEMPVLSLEELVQLSPEERGRLLGGEWKPQ
jgi:hypothetical protein